MRSFLILVEIGVVVNANVHTGRAVKRGWGTETQLAGETLQRP
jgi:hypothetical protein